MAPAELFLRNEHDNPGNLLHIDTKKVGRIEPPSHRVTGNRRELVEGAGWEAVFVAVDDHARIADTAMNPDEKLRRRRRPCARQSPTTPALASRCAGS